MPEKHSNRIKDPELYDRLREDGASAQKAARISNAAAARGRSAVSSTGGRAKDYDEMTVPELKRKAKSLGISGYSNKRKAELVRMIRNS